MPDAKLETLIDEKDVIRLKKSRGISDTLREIAQFPPFNTPHFNDDGNNQFRSKAMICVFGPSMCALILIAMVCIVPIFTDEILQTTISTDTLDYGFQMVNN